MKSLVFTVRIPNENTRYQTNSGIFTRVGLQINLSRSSRGVGSLGWAKGCCHIVIRARTARWACFWDCKKRLSIFSRPGSFFFHIWNISLDIRSHLVKCFDVFYIFRTVMIEHFFSSMLRRPLTRWEAWVETGRFLLEFCTLKIWKLLVFIGFYWVLLFFGGGWSSSLERGGIALPCRVCAGVPDVGQVSKRVNTGFKRPRRDGPVL